MFVGICTNFFAPPSLPVHFISALELLHLFCLFALMHARVYAISLIYCEWAYACRCACNSNVWTWTAKPSTRYIRVYYPWRWLNTRLLKKITNSRRYVLAIFMHYPANINKICICVSFLSIFFIHGMDCGTRLVQQMDIDRIVDRRVGSSN